MTVLRSSWGGGSMMSNPVPHILLARLDALEDVLKLGYDAIRTMRREIREAHPESFPPPVPLKGLGDTLPSYAQDTSPDPSWIPILHSMQRAEIGFPPPCNGVALYLTEPPQEGKRADLSLMRVRPPFTETWKIPERGIDEPRCASCGILVDPFSNADLDYLSRMLPAGASSPKRSKQKTPRDRRTSGADQSAAIRGVAAGSREGSPDLPVDLPPTLPGHTAEADFDVMKDLARIQDLAKSSGLLDS